MKVIIDGYEVLIQAKRVYDDSYNLDATMSVLNSINLWQYSEADLSMMRYEQDNTKTCYKQYADMVYERCAELHKTLETKHLYD